MAASCRGRVFEESLKMFRNSRCRTSPGLKLTLLAPPLLVSLPTSLDRFTEEVGR